MVTWPSGLGMRNSIEVEMRRSCPGRVEHLEKVGILCKKLGVALRLAVSFRLPVETRMDALPPEERHRWVQVEGRMAGG